MVTCALRSLRREMGRGWGPAVRANVSHGGRSVFSINAEQGSKIYSVQDSQSQGLDLTDENDIFPRSVWAMLVLSKAECDQLSSKVLYQLHHSRQVLRPLPAWLQHDPLIVFADGTSWFQRLLPIQLRLLLLSCFYCGKLTAVVQLWKLENQRSFRPEKLFQSVTSMQNSFQCCSISSTFCSSFCRPCPLRPTS